jgi:hypothetical protein
MSESVLGLIYIGLTSTKGKRVKMRIYIGLTSTKGKRVMMRKERGRSEPGRRNWIERFAESASNSNSNEFYSVSNLNTHQYKSTMHAASMQQSIL